MRRVRRTAALAPAAGPGVVVGLVLSLVLAGCGGSDPKTVAPTSDPPAPTPSSASSTPTPTATPTQEPLSPFESRPPVEAARKFLAAVGRAVNANDRSMAALTPFTAGDAARFAKNANSDFGLFYPGPMPFTPVVVKVRGSSANVPGCLWSDGWAQKRSTKLPAHKRSITAVNISLTKVAGAWKVANVVLRTSGGCKNVNVKGVAW